MKAGTIVRATWDDHSFEFGSFGRKGIQRHETVGHLVEDNEDWVAIALTKNNEGFEDTVTIDRRMLISLRRVT